MTRYTQIKKLLYEFLNELNDEVLREFQWQMGASDRPRPIQLVDATRQETVDKLVQVYGEEDAVATTVEIFLWMKLNDLVEKLLEAHTDRIGKEKLHEPEPVATSASENHREADLISSDLSCAICFCIFTDPVTLPCGHSFCRVCVHNCRKCPLCRKVIPDTALQSTLSLKNMSENYRKGNLFQPSGGQRNESHQSQSRETATTVHNFHPNYTAQSQSRETAATVHNFHPNYTAQKKSNVVAPSFTGCSIGNININITSNGEPSVVFPKETLNHDTVQFCDSSVGQIKSQSFNTAAPQHHRNPFEDSICQEEKRFEDALLRWAESNPEYHWVPLSTLIMMIRIQQTSEEDDLPMYFPSV